MNLRSRMDRLEARVSDDDRCPRAITIWTSPDYSESWTEEDGPNGLAMHVKVPWRDSDPFDHLTGEQRGMIRPADDRVVIVEATLNARDAQFQHDIPPWRRRPFRLDADGRSYELQGEDGIWRPSR